MQNKLILLVSPPEDEQIKFKRMLKQKVHQRLIKLPSHTHSQTNILKRML